MEVRRRRLLAVLVALCLPALAPRAATLDDDIVTYDSLMKSEPVLRRATFAHLSPEKKSDLMKTHMRRWRAAHGEQLSDAQRQIVDDNIAAIAPDFYREPTTPEWRDKAIALFRRASEVFTKDEMIQLFTLDGEYIPEPP